MTLPETIPVLGFGWDDLLFMGLAAAMLGAALLVVTMRDIIRCGLAMIVCFGALAGLYVLAGATVVAAARGERKLALARELGAHEVVDYGEPDWPNGVEPVDVVFSSVGGAVARQSFELLRDGVGRLAVFGAASGEPLDVTASDVFRKGVAVLGFGNPLGPDTVRRAFTSGLRPVLGEALPLADAARAHELLESRATTGKVVLLP